MTNSEIWPVFYILQLKNTRFEAVKTNSGDPFLNSWVYWTPEDFWTAIDYFQAGILQICDTTQILSSIEQQLNSSK